MSTPDPLVRAPVRAYARPDDRRHRLAVWLRYCAVSAVSTGTSLTTLGVLVGVAGVDATVANVVATAVGTIPSFEMNRRWVWARHGRRSVTRQVVPFVALSFAGLVLSTVAVHVAAARTADWSPGLARRRGGGRQRRRLRHALGRPVLRSRPGPLCPTGFAGGSQLGRSRVAGPWPRVRPWQRPWPHQLPSANGRTRPGHRRRPVRRRPVRRWTARRRPEVTAGGGPDGSCPPSSPS